MYYVISYANHEATGEKKKNYFRVDIVQFQIRVSYGQYT